MCFQMRPIKAILLSRGRDPLLGLHHHPLVEQGSMAAPSSGAGDRMPAPLPDFPVLQVFCNQVGISLRNAMLYKELKSRNIELSSLYEVSRVLLGTLDYKEVMRTILVNAKKLVNAESCFIYELDPVHNMLRCISSVSEPPVSIEEWLFP